MDWNDVRHFLALARLGNVRAAGTSLGVSHSTVARRVDALEERLAARLFDRTRDGYSLTDAGRQMVPGAERIEHEMNALERGVAGQDERLAGEVSITCCDRFVSDFVMPSLLALVDEHPGIELRVTTDSRSFDLSKREADIAIRILGADGTPPEHLIGNRLAPMHVANYVATEHAERLDPQRGVAVRWLSFDPREMHEPMIASSSYPELPPWGCFSSLELLVQATLHGFGLSMLPTYVGDHTPGLQRMPHPDRRHVADLWLLSHPDLRENARFRRTRAVITETIRGQAQLFNGELRCSAATVGPEIATS